METRQTKEIVDGYEKLFLSQRRHHTFPWPFWTCPEHVPKYGGMQTSQTLDDWYCFNTDVFQMTLPEKLIAVILLCLDDTEIWKIQFEQDIERKATELR